MFRALRFLFALPLVLLVAGSAWADPPGRVGRLALIDGEVSLRPADSRRWESASVNWPLTSGDALSTEAGSRAEVRIGSSVLRLDGSTSIDIRQLDDERIRIELERGSVAIRIRSREAASAVEIETRDGLVVADKPGQYRVDYEDAATVLTNYRGGELDFRSEDSDVVVTEGRRARILFSDHTEVRWSDPERDDFSDWTLARDERDDRLGEPRHVSPEMTGAEDLYEYGDWRTVDDYGPVWYPRSVPPGWAPYRSGRWVLVQPWGWTWVDEAPWGFAPFHYGRWVMIGGTWGWVPGVYVPRPVYAPALVVWMGLPGVSISLSSGSLPHIGWFPLGPREVYVPSYRHSTTYVRRINITHVTNVVHIDRARREPRHAHYVHRDRREAVTLVPGEVVRHSRPVFRHALRDDERKGRPPRAATPVPPLDPRLVVEHDRVERATRPRDEERLRDEQARRSARLREAVEERRQRERAWGPEERRLRDMPDDGRGREAPPGRRIDGREQGPAGTDDGQRVERERERRLPSAPEARPRDPIPAMPQRAPQQHARELQQRQQEQEQQRQQRMQQQRDQEQQQQERAREQAQHQRALEQQEQQRRQTMERQAELRQRQSQQREHQQQEQLQRQQQEQEQERMQRQQRELDQQRQQGIQQQQEQQRRQAMTRQEELRQRQSQELQRQQQERMQQQQRELEQQRQQRMQQQRNQEQQRSQAMERQEELRQRQSQERERQLRQQQDQQQDPLQRQQRQLERQREMQERQQSEQRRQMERRAAGNEGGDAPRGERRRAGDEGRPAN